MSRRVGLSLVLLGLLVLAAPAHARHVAATGNEETICTRAEVMLCENWEGRTAPGTAAQFLTHGYKNDGWPTSEVVTQTVVTTQAHDGTKSLQHFMAATPRATQGGGSGFMEASFGEQVRTAYIRMYLKYSSDYVRSPNGEKVFFFQGTGGATPIRLEVGLLFGQDFPALNYGYGPNLYPNMGPANAGSLGVNTWKCLEIRVTLPDPINSNNGVYEGWVNDVQFAGYYAVSNLGHPSLTGSQFFNSMLLSGYWNCEANDCTLPMNAHPDMERWTDRIVASKSRIGCSGSAPTADNVNPTGSISAPATGNVSGLVNVSVTAADTAQAGVTASGVQSVLFKLGGAAFPSGSGCENADLAAPYSCTWDTRTAVQGAAVNLSCTVTDGAGNTGTCANVSVTPSNTAVDPVSPRALWAFTTNGTDASGNSLTATFANGAAISGSRLVMDGVDDTATPPVSSLLNFTTALSVATYVNHTGTGVFQRVISHGDQAASPFWEWGILISPAGVPSCELGFGSGGSLGTLSAPSAIPTATDTHLVCTWDGTTEKLYVNFIEVASRAVSGTLPAHNNTTTIGYRDVAGTPQRWFKGQIWDMRVWPRAISASEVAGIGGNVIPPPPPPPPGSTALFGDTTLAFDDVNYSSADDCLLQTWQAGKYGKVCLLKVDMTNVPTSATLTTCPVTLYMLGATGTSGTTNVTIHKVINVNPIIGRASGATYNGTNAWSASTATGNGSGQFAMGMGDVGAALATVNVGSTPGPKVWAHADLVAVCQGWVTDPTTNYGFILRLDTAQPVDATIRFASFDNVDPTLRPVVQPATTTAEQPLQNRSIRLRWLDNSKNEHGFSILRSTDNVTYTEITRVGPNITTYTDTGLLPATTYYYKVQSYVILNGEYSPSSPTAAASFTTPAALPAPTPCKARPVIQGDETLTVYCSDTSDVESGFQFWRAINGGAFVQIASTAANVPQYTDGGPLKAPAKVYQYDASPEGFVDETADAASTATGDVTAFPATEAVGDRLAICHSEPFSRVTVVAGTAGTVGTVTWKYYTSTSSLTAFSNVVDNTAGFLALAGTTSSVTWDSPTDWVAVTLNPSAPDATSLYCVAAEVTGVYTVNPILSQIQVNGLLDGIDYCYRIRPVNNSGNAAFTPDVCGRTLAAPVAPSGLVAE